MPRDPGKSPAASHREQVEISTSLPLEACIGHTYYQQSLPGPSNLSLRARTLLLAPFRIPSAISCSACSFFIVLRRYLVDGPKSRARCMLRVRRTCWSVRHCIHRRRARLECVLHRQGQRQWTTPLYGGVRAAIPEDGGDAPGEGGHGCSACGARPPAATTPRQSGRLARPCKVPCTDSVRDPCAAPRRTRSPARCVCSSLVANTVTMGWVGVPTGICPAIQYVHLAQGTHIRYIVPERQILAGDRLN